jgi:hypothetical protein
MSKITYALLNNDSPAREEIPLTAKTDRGARIAARRMAEKYGIKKYRIIFYRDSDGCRGWID